jgi:hypothetical protein
MSTVLHGRKVATPADIAQPGDWCLEQSGEFDKATGVAAFCYRAPDGSRNSGDPENFPYDHIYIRTGEKQDGYWHWDGNVESPTISPSILHRGASSWHGFFEAGHWRTL